MFSLVSFLFARVERVQAISKVFCRISSVQLSRFLPPSARGLDIPLIKTVINFDVAKEIDTHVHRIGRTGRAGEKGTAFTLVTNKDVHFAGSLVRNLVSH